MALENFGYQEEKMKVRVMTLAELKVSIAQELLKKNYRHVTIKLVCVTDGEVDIYESLEDFLVDECILSWKVGLLSVREILVMDEGAGCGKTNIIIVIRDEEIEE